MPKYYHYYVEGKDEEKLVNELKTGMGMICSGKTDVFNIVQNEFTNPRLMQLRSDTVVVLIYDTDAERVKK